MFKLCHFTENFKTLLQTNRVPSKHLVQMLLHFGAVEEGKQSHYLHLYIALHCACYFGTLHLCTHVHDSCPLLCVVVGGMPG